MHQLATISLAVLLVAEEHDPLAARDGTMGSRSMGQLTIRVSVTPRAWQANPPTLCVSAPSGRFSVAVEAGSSGGSVPATRNHPRCGGSAYAVDILPGGADYRTVIVRAE